MGQTHHSSRFSSHLVEDLVVQWRVEHVPRIRQCAKGTYPQCNLAKEYCCPPAHKTTIPALL